MLFRSDGVHGPLHRNVRLELNSSCPRFAQMVPGYEPVDGDCMSPGHKDRQTPRSARRLRRALLIAAAAGTAALGMVLVSNLNDGSGSVVVATPNPSSVPTLQTTPEPIPTKAGSPTGDGTEPEEEKPEVGPTAGSEPVADPDGKSGAAGPEPGPKVAVDAELATQDLPVAAPVDISAGSSDDAGIDIRITEMEAVDGEAQGIGEIAGPAVRFTVSVINNSGKPIDFANAVMTVDAGAANLPCTQLSGPEAVPLPPAAEPGQTVTGKYVFLIPAEDRDLVTVYLSYSTDAPVAAFKGAVPTP